MAVKGLHGPLGGGGVAADEAGSTVELGLVMSFILWPPKWRIKE